MKRPLKKILIPAALLALVFFVVPHLAYAIWPFPSLGEIVSGVLRLLAYVLNFIFGTLFMLGAMLAKAILDLNFNILTTQNGLVQVGWKISRDLANLGFVLLIIFIAFGTILRIESYGAKKLLPMLIGAAIIVNFSLAIGGVFINFSNVLSNSFITKMGDNFTTSIAGAFGAQRLLLPPDNPPPPDPAEQGGALVGFSSVVLIGLANLIFISVFTLIAALVMFLIAGMLLIRYIVLSFLLILAPITWLFWAFPSLKHLFSKWWSSFIEWVFFAPAMLFFVYIAVLSAQNLKDVIQPTGSGFSGILSTVMSTGMQMVVLAGVLVGGVIAAQKMGIAGASAAVNAGKKVGKSTQKWAGKQAAKGASYPLRTVTGRKTAEKLQTFGAKSGFIGRTLSAPLRQIGAALSDARLKSEDYTTKGVRNTVRGRSIEENARRLPHASSEEKNEILKFFRDMIAHGNTAQKEAANKAVRNAPERVLDKEARLKFLYGGGGVAGTRYGMPKLKNEGRFFPRIEFRNTFVEENMPETKEADKLEQVKRLLFEEGGGAPAPGGTAPTGGGSNSH